MDRVFVCWILTVKIVLTNQIIKKDSPPTPEKSVLLFFSDWEG